MAKNNNNTSDILAVFKASQATRQGKARQDLGIKLAPSGKLYINLDDIKQGDHINIVYGKQSIIFRVATGDELELAKADKAIASHIYKVSGTRHAVSIPQWARDMLALDTPLFISLSDMASETVEGLTYYRAIIQ